MDTSSFAKTVDRIIAELAEPPANGGGAVRGSRPGSPPTVFVEPSRLSLLRNHYWPRLRHSSAWELGWRRTGRYAAGGAEDRS